MLEKLQKQIDKLETDKQNILIGVRQGSIRSVDGIIKAGKDLELIRVKIWAIDEAIRK